MNRLEEWLNRVYEPNPEPWKRKVLLWISSVLLIVVAALGYAQYSYGFTSNDIWWLLGVFGFLGAGGLFTALFGSDFWVAMFLGRV